ncbi:MAG: hypothetical protein KAI83_09335 [Thiomargarita sp.]|nr:hypothetical protein [Thiomargarita sp.]
MYVLKQKSDMMEFNAFASTGGLKFPDHFKGKEIRFFEKIGFIDGLKISALQH